ncbi:TetR/AcrR family transcriptional regulator [Pseudonocardia spinosispora]|uniref:TetR/AcrR family transcriptional regulator n=1 Tax=Pseudonocardia spinosispora TaxID=103441 RepID=UPI0003FDD54D|nr:TetR/AcrR family transcriptional regulator [Pseudonocardia spinosispora]
MTEQPSRWERRRDRRTQEILATAAELFGRHGYDSVSLEDVAERLDVTKGSLYHYFASKDELGTAAIETLGNDWSSRLEALAEEQTGTATQRLRALVQRQIAIAVRDHPAALRLFLVPNEWPDAQRARIKELRRRHDRIFRTVVEQGVGSGEFTVTSVDTVLQCLHAAMTQAPQWCGELDDEHRDRAILELTETLLKLVR